MNRRHSYLHSYHSLRFNYVIAYDCVNIELLLTMPKSEQSISFDVFFL